MSPLVDATELMPGHSIPETRLSVWSLRKLDVSVMSGADVIGTSKRLPFLEMLNSNLKGDGSSSKPTPKDYLPLGHTNSSNNHPAEPKG